MKEKQRKYLNEYKEHVTQLLGQLSLFFEDCKAVEMSKNAFMLMCENDMFLLSHIRKHYDHLNTPLPECICYTAPLNRLKSTNGSPNSVSTFYDAYIYDDIDTVLKSDHTLLKDLCVKQKWDDSRFDNDSKCGVFDFLRAINDCVYHVMEVQPPSTYTVDEIDNEVKRKKDEECLANDKVANLTFAFSTLLKTFVEQVHSHTKSEADHIKMSEVMKYMEESEERSHIKMWDDIMKNEIDGVSLYESCNTENWESFREGFKEIEMPLCSLPLEIFDDNEEIQQQDIWPKIKQMNLLSRVHTNTPTHIYLKS